MLLAESGSLYEQAALHALAYADFLAARVGPEPASVLTLQAQVYASLHQADTILFVAENRNQTYVVGP
jgi:hypothetical protein